MDQVYQSWLEQNIQGADLVSERSHIVSQFVKTFPDASLRDIQRIDDDLKALLYQSHKRFEVEGVIVCACKKVTQEKIYSTLEKFPSLEALKEQTHAGTGCGKCVPDLIQLIEKKKPKALRWHGETHSYWSAKIQNGLDLWNERVKNYPALSVKSFDQGQTVISVDGVLNSDEEWDLSSELSDYLADGFPEPLLVFLDFAHSAAKN